MFWKGSVRWEGDLATTIVRWPSLIDQSGEKPMTSVVRQVSARQSGLRHRRGLLALVLWSAGACDSSPIADGPLRRLADSLAQGQSWQCQPGGVACLTTLGDTLVYFFGTSDRRVGEVTREARLAPAIAAAELSRIRDHLTALHGAPFDCPPSPALQLSSDTRWWLATGTTFVLRLRKPSYQEEPAHPRVLLGEHVVLGHRTCAWTPEAPPFYE